MRRGDIIGDCGLVIRRGRMFWGLRHGSLRWAPLWIRGLVISAWNHVACRVIGHEPFTYPLEAVGVGGQTRCTNCSKEFA